MSGNAPSYKQEKENPRRYKKARFFKIVYRIFKPKNEVRAIDIIHDKENPVKWDAL